VVSDLQKRTAQAIINVFETGRPRGDYASVVFHPQDPGQLTYGRSQTTLASGNLALLIAAYCRADGAVFAEALRPYLGRLQSRDPALNTDVALRGLLREAGGDPVMRATQDAFFDRVYWVPAVTSAASAGIATALGTAVVYDGTVHGAWALIRDRVTAAQGTPKTAGEKPWIKAYVDTRRAWLAGHSNPLLRLTVYRMDTFRELIGADNWDLTLPLRAHGTLIDAAAVLGTGAPIIVSAAEAETRLLSLQRPFLAGDDVRQLQAALARAGHKLAADGVFGPATDKALRAFQKKRKLVEDGIAGAAVRAALKMV
jgi:chitosanase